MLWGKKDEELPEVLRGKKPEEIAEAVKKAQDLEAANAAALQAKADAEKAAADARTALETTQQKLRDLEANRPPVTPPAPDDPPSPWLDPDKFVEDKTKKLQETAVLSGMLTAKMYCTQNLSPRDQKIFKMYEKEIDATVGSFIPEQRVMPQSWFNALIYIKGLHENDIRKAEADKTDFFSETPTRGGAPEPQPEAKLTEEEQQVCRVMHWDPKQYLQRKQEGQLAQSEKGAYAHYTVPERKGA